jgi:hypothetical protein
MDSAFAPYSKNLSSFKNSKAHCETLVFLRGVAARSPLEFSFWTMHHVALSVKAAMPLTGPIPEGQAFFCPRCGAHYAMTHSRRGKNVETNDDRNVAKCVVCGQAMATWDATDAPTFKLIHRPEDA